MDVFDVVEKEINEMAKMCRMLLGDNRGFYMGARKKLSSPRFDLKLWEFKMPNLNFKLNDITLKFTTSYNSSLFPKRTANV